MSGEKVAHEVFGVSPEILPDSYIDRGSLDSWLTRQLKRANHLALRGESKCGKSWLRQKVVENPIVVQCRLRKSVVDIYIDILSQLEVRLILEDSRTGKLKGSLEATGSVGASILGKIGIKFGGEGSRETTEKATLAGHTADDLKFIADIIHESKRRVIIEDFHYMSISDRTVFAYDLKTFWDYKLSFIIVGVWTKTNMLLTLNPDLTNRIKEASIIWTQSDLYSLIDKGANALGITFQDSVRSRLVENSFGNVAILQRILLTTLDKHYDANGSVSEISDSSLVEAAELEYAEELDALYQTFASRVAANIRNRRDSTGINAYALSTILDSSDEALIEGLSIDTIFDLAHAKQPRIQKGNLRTVLENFERRQIDSDGRGLVFSYNEHTSKVTIVDKQLLFYRRFSTLKWPWEDMIKEADASNTGFNDEPELPL